MHTYIIRYFAVTYVCTYVQKYPFFLVTLQPDFSVPDPFIITFTFPEIYCMAKVGGSLFQIAKSLIANYGFLLSGAKERSPQRSKERWAISENLKSNHWKRSEQKKGAISYIKPSKYVLGQVCTRCTVPGPSQLHFQLSSTVYSESGQQQRRHTNTSVRSRSLTTVMPKQSLVFVAIQWT